MTSINVFVEYNPLTVRTIIKIDGKTVEESHDIFTKTKINNSRLHVWIDEFFPNLFRELNTNEICFVFEGTKDDVVDIDDAINLFHARSPEKVITKGNWRVHELNLDEKLGRISDLFEQAKEGPVESFRDPSIHKAFAKALSSEFDVTVVGTMSAGKSTVINAMVGWELLPSKNAACTAMVTRIIDDDSTDVFKIRRSFREHEESSDSILCDEWSEIDPKTSLCLLDKWNSDPLTHLVEIKGNIPNINERNGVQIVLVDTPGPNNSNDLEHGQITRKAISSDKPSLVLYLLNATQIATDDDKTVLNLIREEMDKHGREAHDRFIFVANKFDEFDPKKEPLEKQIKDIKEYLVKNGIKHPIVIPMSANLAKLIRMQRGGHDLTEDDEDKLNSLIKRFSRGDDRNLIELAKNDLNANVYNKLKDRLAEYREQQNGSEKVAELLSGIPILEALFDNYLTKYAMPVKIKDAVDVFYRVVNENEISKKLESILSLHHQELEKVSEQLKKFQEDSGRIERANDFRKKLKKKEFHLDDDTEKKIQAIDLKINSILDNLQKNLASDILPPKAKELLSNTEKEIKNLIGNIEFIIDEELERIKKAEIDQMIEDYKGYVKDLLSSSDDVTSMVTNLQKASLTMPDAQVLIDENQYEEKAEKEFTVQKRTWYTFFFGKKDVKETRTEVVSKVNMESIAKEIEVHLRTYKRESFVALEKTCKLNFDKSKETVLAQMDELDEKMKETISNINKAASDSDAKEKLRSEMQNKIQWLEGIMGSLSAVLKLQS